jgi:hypothetical protein
MVAIPARHSLLERLEALKGIYMEDDAYMQVDIDDSSNTLHLVQAVADEEQPIG